MQLVDAILYRGICPEMLVCFLFKNKRNPNEPNNYRSCNCMHELSFKGFYKHIDKTIFSGN